MNNYKFWEDYNQKCINNIKSLIAEKRKQNQDFVLTDLHLHSDCSSDGKQTLSEIIEKSQEIGLEIIALTDHDSVEIFDQLYYLIKEKKLPSTPIIITGIEHTVSFKEYQTMCHILKYFINPKSKK